MQKKGTGALYALDNSAFHANCSASAQVVPCNSIHPVCSVTPYIQCVQKRQIVPYDSTAL